MPSTGKATRSAFTDSSSEPVRKDERKLGDAGLEKNPVRSNRKRTYAEHALAGEAKSEAILLDSPGIDPDLAQLIAAWPTLPHLKRQMISKLIEGGTCSVAWVQALKAAGLA